MDFLIRFIGLVVIVGAGASPVTKNTAFIPKWASGQTFCSGTIKNIPEHRAFVRVATSSVDTANTDWTDQSDCKALSPSTTEKCTVFFIKKTSFVTVNPGFNPLGSSVLGTTFNSTVPRLGAADPMIQLSADPFGDSAAWLELPPGTVEAVTLSNMMVSSQLRVVAPTGTKSQSITIQAVPRGGGKTLKLVIAAGTEVAVGFLPPSEAGLPFTATNPNPSHHEHFFLVNTILHPNHQFCSLPDLDAFCSNQGCCP